MLNISKPLSASQAQTYHEREFTAAEQNYWKQGDTIQGEWHGRLAEGFGLSGAVGAEEFARLSEGQHPETGEQLVLHRTVHQYKNADGETIAPVEHRAGWDATFSAPKSISLTALVGGDDQVREAHREAVNVALNELEKYTQARIGNVHAPETTGKFVAATFEHDTARPVDGYAAPQLHTHAVIFNVTERDNGQTRALQPQELFASQRYTTSVYRSELSMRLQGLGYELERGKHGQPEIKGYTKEYLEASSPRREQIKDHLREMGIDGAGPAQVAAHRTRDSKELLSPGEVLERHRELAAQYGHQADKVVAEARAHEQRHVYEPALNRSTVAAQQALTYARDHLFERSAVLDRRDILEAALNRGMGETTYAHVRQEFAQRAARGEFRTVGAGQQYTTAAMLRMEREIVTQMQEGNQRGMNDPMLVSPQIRITTEDRHPELNTSQRQAVEQIFLSREKMVGLDGVAGAGKTTTLAVIREGAEAQGYKVEGFAPTSRAAQKLADAGMETSTLQKHLVRGQKPDTGERRLYVLDESSLASTKQMHEFVHRLHPNDRVLLVGDRRQHEAVEAGRPFAQLQDAGMKTVKLEEIVRQKNPELKQLVEQLARGEVREAVQGLERQGRVHEIAEREDRIAAIAKEYAKSPEGTLVVSPDNRSRVDINLAIRAEMQERGLVSKDEHPIAALVPRQDLTGPERTWAARYEFNDVVRYARASKQTGMERGEYARVKSVDAEKNLLTVVRAIGSELTYDPRRQQGVSVYREEPRSFAVGDRIQFTAPANDLKVANRELGTVVAIEDGQVRLKMDGGREVQLDPREHPHLDHGYAVTSHSSQGQTAERVLIHVDTELAAKDLLNSRMAYVAVSRGAEDAQIYTNDRAKLPEALGHDVSHESAHTPAIKPEQAIAPKQEIAQVIEQSIGMGQIG